MAAVDFDLDSLATYLHLTPGQVERLATRGKIPGRKVGGGWRFSQAEIHHWLEDRIGVADIGELDEVEVVLETSARKEGDDPISLAHMMPLSAVAAPLNARTRNSVILAMSQLAANTGLLWDQAAMSEAVRAREDLFPTTMENGVAMLHPRRPMQSILGEPIVALGRTSQGIPFGGGGLTDIFFLICSTDDRTHLRTLARISRLMTDDGLLAALRDAPDAVSMRELLIEREDELKL